MIFKKIKNAIFSVILVLFTATALFQVKVFADSPIGNQGNCGFGVTYSFDEPNGTLTISGTGKMYDYSTEDAPWQSFKNSIRCVIVAGNIYRIGNNTFAYCENLNEVILSEGVKEIGNFTFSNCTNLKKLNLPNSLNYIGKDAFLNCKSLEKLTILGNMKFIGHGAFYNCTALNEVVMQGDIEQICAATFSSCISLKEVTIKGNVKNISNGTFCNCTSLTSFSYFGSVELENENVFLYCPRLCAIKVSENYRSENFGGIQVLNPTEWMNANMVKKYYAAYGSNLNVRQMRRRCPDARIIGTSEIPDYELLFKGSKTDACLTVEPKAGSRVPVVIWSVTSKDEAELDCYEGFPMFYYKKEMELPIKEIKSGKIINCTTFVYIMHKDRPFGIPSEPYLKTCLEGYHRFGFSDKILLQALSNGRKYCYEGE